MWFTACLKLPNWDHLLSTRYQMCFILLNFFTWHYRSFFKTVSHHPITWQGLVPAGIRLIPHTVLTFVFLEQLKKYFGIRVISWTLTSWPFPFGLLLKLLSLPQYYSWKIAHYTVTPDFTVLPDQHNKWWFITIRVRHNAHLTGERKLRGGADRQRDSLNWIFWE